MRTFTTISISFFASLFALASAFFSSSVFAELPPPATRAVISASERDPAIELSGRRDITFSDIYRPQSNVDYILIGIKLVENIFI